MMVYQQLFHRSNTKKTVKKKLMQTNHLHILAINTEIQNSLKTIKGLPIKQKCKKSYTINVISNIAS